MSTRAYGATAAQSPLAPLSIERRAVQPNDVAIEILYCGVCHSDLHQARNEWSNTLYPCVPGHEIVGRVTAVGSQVTRFKLGEHAAVGCMVDSCRTCASCTLGLEQYCERGFVGTYNGPDVYTGKQTFGGYAEAIVVDQAFVLSVPPNLDLAATAPLLCAGVTTFSPLRHWKVGPGQKVGIVGLGGLGHMGVKLARALGAHVVAFTTSKSKVEDARRLGAHEVVISSQPSQLADHRASFDFILDTVSAVHDINAYFQLLKLDATLTQVGAPGEPLPVSVFNLFMPRRRFSGSLIGGIAETQEMLNFCAEHNVVADIELIDIQQINEAYERMLRGDVHYRFVIDMASIKQ